jgi:hypothetical protein
LGSFSVQLQTRRIFHPKLLGQVLDHPVRNIQHIDGKRPEVANRDQLRGETESHVIQPTFRDQRTIRVIKKEQTIQISLRRRAPIPAETSRLLVAQELDRHSQARYDANERRLPAQPTDRRPNPYRWILFHCSPSPMYPQRNWILGDRCPSRVLLDVFVRAVRGHVTIGQRSACAFDGRLCRRFRQAR